MKTERRHDLQTNVLADWLGGKVESVRPYFRILVGGAIGVVVVAAVYFYLSNQQSSAREQAWQDLYAALSDDDFELLGQVAEHHSGSDIGLWAFQAIGDRFLNDGARLLYSDREEADKQLAKAFANFDIVSRTAREPMLKRRALYALAKTHEARNEMDRAEKNYQLLAESWPGSYLGTEAESRLKSIRDRNTQNFYAWFFEAEPPAMPIGPGSLNNFGNPLPNQPAMDGGSFLPGSFEETRTESSTESQLPDSELLLQDEAPSPDVPPVADPVEEPPTE